MSHHSFPFHILILLVLALGSLSWDAFGVVLSNSRLELCDRTSPDDSQLQCKQKVSINIAINQGQRDEVQYTLNEVEGQTMKEPLTIVVRKSMPKILYPLYYIQDFNAKPFERIVYKEDLLVSECRDDAGVGHPTCGYEFDSNNEPIFASQGFCCSCSLAEQMGLQQPDARGVLDCTAFLTKKSSAHCMRYGDLWYSAFELGLEQREFDIEIEVRNTVTEKMVKKLTLSPEEPGITDPLAGLYAKLIGDFQSFQGLPNFGSKLLFAASFPLDDPIVKAGNKFWMFVEKTMVTKDGSECNKVGVSHRTFRSQGRPCENKKMTCLQNQLQDLHNQDVAMAKQGRVGNYFISNNGNFSMKSGDHVLEMVVDDNVASSVLLVLDAKDVKFVRNLSTGRITKGVVETFESMSRDGLMIVDIINTGDISAEFVMTVTECSSNINPVISKSKEVPPSAEQSITFDISTTTKFESSNQCTVTLMDAAYAVVDRVIVKFDTSATVIHRTEEPNTNGTKETIFSGLGGGGSCDSCLFINLLCKAVSGCFRDLIVVAAIVIGVIVLIAGLIIFTAAGGWNWVFFALRFMTASSKCLKLPKPPQLQSSGPKKREEKKLEMGSMEANYIPSMTQSRNEPAIRDYLQQMAAMSTGIPRHLPQINPDGIGIAPQKKMSGHASLIQLLRQGSRGCCFLNVNKEHNARLHELVSGFMPAKCGLSFSIAGNIVPHDISLRELKEEVMQNDGTLPSDCMFMFVIHKRMDAQVLTFNESQQKWKRCRQERKLGARTIGPIPLERCLSGGLLTQLWPKFHCINQKPEHKRK